MAAARALLDRLELAGICCRDFREPLQKACQDSSSLAVLEWLGRQADEGLLSDNQALLLQQLNPEVTARPRDQASPVPIQKLITRVQQERESHSLLEVCPSEEELCRSIAHQEATLLQLQSQLRSLQALSSATNKQSPAAAQSQAVAKYHDKHTNSRLAINRKRLDDQQAACNTLLHETHQTASDLHTKFEQHSSSWLLSLSDLQSLHKQDAQFQADMDRLYKKQFQSGPAASIHEQHTSSDWLQDHDPLQPNSLHNILQGSDSQAYEDDVQELDRLRWIHEASQMQHITTLAWQAKQEAMLGSMRASVDRVATMQEPALMQAELTHLTAELKKLTVHKQQLLNDQLPALCHQVAALQDTEVLQQDYNVKLLRQNYYISKKQAFIDLLVEQQSRQQLLQLAREEEVRRLQATQQELQLLHELLSDVRVVSQQRMSHYAQKQLQPVMEPQLVVHDDDSFLHTLDRLLPETVTDTGSRSQNDNDKAKLYVTFEQLGQKLAALADQDASAVIQQQAQRMQTGVAASMQAAFSQLHPLAFPDKEIADAQLTAPQLGEAMQMAQAASLDLTSTVNKVAQQQQTYHNILHQQKKQLSAERGVFSLFHTQPERLAEACSV